MPQALENPIHFYNRSLKRGSNSVVECNLAKVEVAGSNPVSRSMDPRGFASRQELVKSGIVERSIAGMPSTDHLSPFSPFLFWKGAVSVPGSIGVPTPMGVKWGPQGMFPCGREAWGVIF